MGKAGVPAPMDHGKTAYLSRPGMGVRTLGEKK